MISNQEKLALIGFAAAYIVGFSAYYIAIKNFEFLWYVAVLVFFFILILATLNRSGFDRPILWGLAIWGFLHMAGGGVRVGDGVLYALELIPIAGSGDAYVLKFDQVVHAFGFAVATLVVFHLLRPYLGERVNWKIVYPIIALGGMGLGVVNEIVEFVAVVIFPETGVGGYYNTALDLVFNTIGAVLATVFIHFYYRPSRPRLNRSFEV
jgi:putative membrane protein